MAEVKYGQGAVYGSLAYDFNNPALYPEEYSTAPTPKARPETQAQPQVRTRARVAPRTRQSIAPASMVGVALAAFIFVTGILAQAKLLDISSDSVKLRQELTELQEQQAKLRITYESAFNMSDIENYATRSLGMQRPQADQICYIDTSAPDKAVVVSDDESLGFVDRVSDFLTGFGEYFR